MDYVFNEGMWVKLIENQTTRSLIQNETMRKLLHFLQQNPTELKHFIDDPRIVQVTGALAGDVSVSVQFDEVTGRLMSDEEIHRKISECKRRLGIPEESEEKKSSDDHVDLPDFYDFTIAKTAGNNFFKDGHWLKALKCYELALEVASTPQEQVIAHSNASMTLFKLHRYTDVEDHCTRALAINNNHLKSLFRRALAREKENKFQEAVDDLEAARHCDATDSEKYEVQNAYTRISKRLLDFEAEQKEWKFFLDVED